MAIDIIKDFETLEFVRDSAVCKVKANDYVLTNEVIALLEYEMVANNIPEHSGMKFEVNGVAIAWVSVNYAQDLGTMTGEYYAYVGDIATSLNFSTEIICARIVNALKAHPNYAEWSKYAWIEYYGENIFVIRAKKSNSSIKKYTSFTDSIFGNSITFNEPGNAYFAEEYVGTLNASANPNILDGSVRLLREDFKLNVDVEVTPGYGVPVTISENYYPANDGYAEIDVAGIVARHFKPGLYNLTGYENVRALSDVQVAVSSFYDDNVQNSVLMSFLALNAYTGKTNKNAHRNLIKTYIEGKVNFLTSLPERMVMNDVIGQRFSIVLKRNVIIDASSDVIDGFSDSTRFQIMCFESGSALPSDVIKINFGLKWNTITKCYQFDVNKGFIAPKLTTMNYNDIDFIKISVNPINSSMQTYEKTIYLDRKTIGDELVFLYKNRFGVMERMVARGGYNEALEMSKQLAYPKKGYTADGTAGNVVAYANESQRTGSAAIGYLGKEYKGYLEDFLNSLEVYMLVGSEYVGVVIADDSYDLESSLENMKSLEFEYSFNEIKRT